MNWSLHVENLKNGLEASFRPKGDSMIPRIESGNLVTVSPDVSTVAEGDVVFCKVKGSYYVHLVKAVKRENDTIQYLIGNNKGRINGWVGPSAVYGKVVRVEA